MIGYVVYVVPKCVIGRINTLANFGKRISLLNLFFFSLKKETLSFRIVIENFTTTILGSKTREDRVEGIKFIHLFVGNSVERKLRIHTRPLISIRIIRITGKSVEGRPRELISDRVVTRFHMYTADRIATLRLSDTSPSLRSVFYFHGNSTSGRGRITLERSLPFAKSCRKFVSLVPWMQSNSRLVEARLSFA